MSAVRRRNWSDNQRTWGPVLYARDAVAVYSIAIDSGKPEYPGCKLTLRGFGHTVLVDLPPILRPYRERVTAASWDAATVERMGRDWYYDYAPREYGFRLSEGGFFQVMYGRQTDDSSTEQRWSCFLPWTEWRHIRVSYYAPDGAHHWTEIDAPGPRSIDSWQVAQGHKDTCPSTTFAFNDFDGERIQATAIIEEREWRFGVGWFKWLSWFRNPKIRRSLNLRFSTEVGRKKGSWKGGTIGHGIEMLPSESVEDAFRRYCARHELAYVSVMP